MTNHSTLIRIQKNDFESENLFSDRQSLTLRYHFYFEIMSIIGRTFFNSPPPDIGSSCLLNLGCGQVPFEGWVNADFFERFWTRKKNANWHQDFRYPLNCQDNYFDGIFSQHTLEHFSPREVHNLLLELRRILKPGAWIRISVPDLEKYVRYYNGDIPHSRFEKWTRGCDALRSLTQNWGHRSVWDYKTFSEVIEAAGFVSVNRCEFNQGNDPRLLKDAEDRLFESLYLEAQKPS